METNLRLFGPVRWSLNGRHIPVGGSQRVCVALQLAEAQGATVSVDSMLNALWTSPPRSGANAVQRHISALRRQLKELGVVAPEDVIQRVNGGYRLHSATSDLTLLGRLLDPASPDPASPDPASPDPASPDPASADMDLVPWWEEPLVGTPWEQTQVLRTRLEMMAERALDKWSELLPAQRSDEVAPRAELMLSHTPGCQAALRSQNRSAKYMRNVYRDHVNAADLSTLRDILGLWAASKGTEGLDLLESRSDALPSDLARRLCRILIWLDPDEPWARHNMSMFEEDAVAKPEQHERSLVTMDARVLEEHRTGDELARSEIDAAETAWDRVRALRVGFMHGLSSPHNANEAELVEDLAAIQHPDAQVEAARFRFINELRQGNLCEADRRLADYTSTVNRFWPQAGDDFEAMARASLQRSTNRCVSEWFGPIQARIGAFAADRWVVPMAELIRRLILPDGEQDVPDDEYFVVANAISSTARSAVDLLLDHQRGEPVEQRVHVIATSLPDLTREKHFMLAPIAVGVLAESFQDRDLATAAAEAIEPWSGQMLGLWPVDYCFGPADEWLDRLAAI